METINKKSLGFTEGMLIGQYMPEYKGGMRQIDWDKAREIIEGNKKDLSYVEAGLAEDWDCTAGEVWNKNKGYIEFENTYVYGASNWATPALSLFYKSGREETVECWKMGNDAKDYFKNIEEE